MEKFTIYFSQPLCLLSHQAIVSSLSPQGSPNEHHTFVSSLPSEVISSLGFLVAFKSSFLKFLQMQSERSPLSDILHSHNSKSRKAGCNTYKHFTILFYFLPFT